MMHDASFQPHMLSPLEEESQNSTLKLNEAKPT
jgi:hypothetical protein